MFDELKQRAQEKCKKNPPAKTAADVSVENCNAEQLMPHVYNQIACADEMKPSPALRGKGQVQNSSPQSLKNFSALPRGRADFFFAL